ncbi:FAD-binding oxidoreductase [Rubrivivax gelatinosus]|uniref:FAD-binding oxidoreductase n=1 Tax=Rubrivivax gelatinosus TaxID=28068 RepID=UPI001F5BBABD|nr:FAD-binding oxidoreductase [Rubrivivax gelatinosus]
MSATDSEDQAIRAAITETIPAARGETPPAEHDGDPLLADLRAIVGAAHAVPGDDAPAALVDQLQQYRGRARAVVRPGSTAEVAAVVRLLQRHRVPIVPQGGNTGLAGGATPDASGEAVVLSLARLDRIRAIDLDNDTLTVEAGVLLDAAREAAQQAGRLFPLSLPSGGSCTVGGNLATNAGGTQVLRFGNTRALTLGIEVVTAEGEVWDGLRGLRKDNAGYDLRDLYIGSEGTLGIITAATLKLFPLPAVLQTAILRVRGIAAVIALLRRARQGFGASLTGFEIMSPTIWQLVATHAPEYRLPFPADEHDDVWHVLIETADEGREAEARDRLADVIVAAVDDGLVDDAVVAESLAQRQAFWRIREHGLGEAQRRDGWNAKHDVSLPISRIPDFVAETGAALAAAFPGVRLFVHGHAGDGNLHVHVGRPLGTGPEYWQAHEAAVRALVQRAVAERGGSICAEHGVGQLKAGVLHEYKPALELALMRRIKAALDPHGLLNPGKVLAR